MPLIMASGGFWGGARRPGMYSIAKGWMPANFTLAEYLHETKT